MHKHTEAGKTSSAKIEIDERGKIKLSGELGLFTVPSLNIKSQNLLDNKEEINIDLADVTRADSAGVALLVDWQREARKLNRTISFHHIPPQMLAIARLCGVDEILSLA